MNENDNSFIKRRAKQLFNDGLIASDDKNFKKARASFMASADCFAAADVYVNWGVMEHYLGNTKLAIDLCKKALTIDPVSAEAHKNIACYLTLFDRYEEAQFWFDKLFNLKEYNACEFIHIHAGKVYVKNSQFDKAKEHFACALNINPSNGDTQKIMNCVNDISEVRKSLKG
jgi:tetratricopeptide (TPR) repeat protein